MSRLLNSKTKEFKMNYLPTIILLTLTTTAVAAPTERQLQDLRRRIEYQQRQLDRKYQQKYDRNRTTIEREHNLNQARQMRDTQPNQNNYQHNYRYRYNPITRGYDMYDNSGRRVQQYRPDTYGGYRGYDRYQRYNGSVRPGVTGRPTIIPGPAKSNNQR